MRVSDYAQYATMTSGREVIHGFMWDSLLYTSGAAGTTVMNFFQQTIAALTPDVTNMQNPGILPYPWQFLVRAIRFFIKQRPENTVYVAVTNLQGGAINNVSQLINTGLLKITHGSKEYGPYPLHAITAGAGPHGGITLGDIGAGAPLLASMVDYGQNGRAHVKNVFTLAMPLLIETAMNFVYQLSWPAGPVTLTRNTTLCLCLEGDLIRQVQ
jgi:hypothetical protein